MDTGEVYVMAAGEVAIVVAEEVAIVVAEEVAVMVAGEVYVVVTEDVAITGMEEPVIILVIVSPGLGELVIWSTGMEELVTNPGTEEDDLVIALALTNICAATHVCAAAPGTLPSRLVFGSSSLVALSLLSSSMSS